MVLMLTVAALASPAPRVAVASGPHASQVAELGRHDTPSRIPARGPLPPRPRGPAEQRVYGYLAYWSNDLATVPWAQITDLALFAATATSSGGLDHTERWDLAEDAVAIAEPYGVRVHLVVTNFRAAELDELLGSAAHRSALIDELDRWVRASGAHGINVDFEGVPGSRRGELVAFAEALSRRVPDVVLATPAVDWSGAWDVDRLTRHADLFLMGYDYHGPQSGHAGPVDPLMAGRGTVWEGVNAYSLASSVADLLDAGARPDRLILGLPLYGRRWPVHGSSLPARAAGRGVAVRFDDAWEQAAGANVRREPHARAPWFQEGPRQTWYGDVASVRDRIAFARGQELAGVGFWALHYTDDPVFWRMVGDATRSGSSPGSAVERAEAGPPLLAWVGDTVTLSAVGASGPAGAHLVYRWRQIQGPWARLVGETTATPSLQIRRPGNLVFAVEVHDGVRWSHPHRADVVVIDPARHRSSSRCGWVSWGGGPATAIGAWLFVLLLRHRSRWAGPRRALL